MEYESRRFCFNAASKYRISKQAFSSSRSIRRLATTCASSRNCLWNVEILLFVNFRIESKKESGMNKLKDSIGSATERAAFLGPGLLGRMFFFLEACKNCADYSLELFPIVLENVLKNLNTQT